MKRVRLTPIAEADITSAVEWYERKRAGLGVTLVERVEEAMGKIAENPQGYAVVFRDLRRANLKQFPYALWFQIRPDKSLVIGRLHGHRDPNLVRFRALGIVHMSKKKDPEPS